MACSTLASQTGLDTNMAAVARSCIPAVSCMLLRHAQNAKVYEALYVQIAVTSCAAKTGANAIVAMIAAFIVPACLPFLVSSSPVWPWHVPLHTSRPRNFYNNSAATYVPLQRLRLRRKCVYTAKFVQGQIYTPYTLPVFWLSVSLGSFHAFTRLQIVRLDLDYLLHLGSVPVLPHSREKLPSNVKHMELTIDKCPVCQVLHIPSPRNANSQPSQVISYATQVAKLVAPPISSVHLESLTARIVVNNE